MKFKERMNAFMVGRYGADQLGRFLTTAALILVIVNLFVRGIAGRIIEGVALACLVWSIFRMFSKNTQARFQENVSYLKIRNRVTAWFSGIRRRIKDAKTHRFFRCPACKTTVRVPKGKGKIRITCPKCGEAFIKKS